MKLYTVLLWPSSCKPDPKKTTLPPSTYANGARQCYAQLAGRCILRSSVGVVRHTASMPSLLFFNQGRDFKGCETASDGRTTAGRSRPCCKDLDSCAGVDSGRRCAPMACEPGDLAGFAAQSSCSAGLRGRGPGGTGGSGSWLAFSGEPSSQAELLSLNATGLRTESLRGNLLLLYWLLL